MTTATKDNWDKASIIGTLLIGTLIPLAITVYGAKINESIKESETSIKYVEIATSVIRDEPKEGKNLALRRWAVNVLTHYSREVPLTLGVT